MHFSYNGLKIGLDHDGDFSFLSHAHADHSNKIKKHSKVIASEETIALAGFSNLEKAKFNTDIKLHEAGHMLGARQLLVSNDGTVSVYTGDISVKKNIFGYSADIVECNELIIEATYGGNPTYKFPDNEQLYSDISMWIKSNDDANLIIGCYDMGKAQEMIKILNERCGIAPVINEKAEHICKVYGSFGISLDRLVVGCEEAEEVMNRRFVSIVPMRHAKRYFASRLAEAFGKKTLCAVATGWALNYRFDSDAAFPLSDHADFYELAYYIEQSNARKINFFAGDGNKVLGYLKNGYV